MDYYRKIMSYADLIYMWGDEHELIAETLSEKIRHVGLVSSDKLEFWTEVVGRIHRNSVYVEITEVYQLENILTATIPSVPDVFKMINSMQMKTWYKRFYDVYDTIQDVAEYQSDLNIRKNMTDSEKKTATIMVLQFFNSELRKGKPMSDLLKYVGLLKISIEGLVISEQLDERFNSFLYDSILPLFRTHNKLVKEFIELVENEEKYTASEKKTSGLELSKVFNRESESKPNIINLDVPDLNVHVDEYGTDLYLGTLGAYIVDLNSNPASFYYKSKSVEREWHRNPLATFFKFKTLLKHLDIDTDEYVIPVPPHIVLLADNVLHSQIKLYSEDSLLEAVVMELHNLIIKYQKLGEPIKEVCISEWEQMYEPILKDIGSLVRLGFVTAKGADEAIKAIRAKGELYGLHVMA